MLHLNRDRALLYSSGIAHSQKAVALIQSYITANELNLSGEGSDIPTAALLNISNSDAL